MAEVKWVKLYIDIFESNDKIKKIRRLPCGNEIVLLWIILLCKAGKCNDGGRIYVTPSEPYAPEDLADDYKFEINTVKLGLEALCRFDMIEISDDGIIYVLNWEEYQNIEGMDKIREQNRLRKQKQRENQKLLDTASRDSHVTVTGRHAIEEEKEEDKEKEYHSINHSLAREENIYIDEKIKEAGFEGRDAEVYREEIKENLRRKYFTGSLGQGVVLMSEEQFGDLCDKLTLDELERYFSIVVECEKSGKRYKKKSHYQAILDMAAKDRRVSKT